MKTMLIGDKGHKTKESKPGFVRQGSVGVWYSSTNSGQRKPLKGWHLNRDLNEVML